jgi:nicotinamidase-related amidase
VLIDVDTQRDLFLADGAGCVRNHRRVLANVRRVVAWARHNNIRMVSTAVCREPSEDESLLCVEGTDGQKKIGYTIRDKHVKFSADGCTDLQREILKRYDQVILEKRCPNPFLEPRADRILSELRADEFVVIGAVTEEAVKATVLGLLARRKNVTLLTDAIGSHNKEAAEVALRQMEAKGANLAEIKALVGPSGLKLVGACDCDRCQGRMKTAVDKAS